MGYCRPIKCTFFSSKRENDVPQWAFEFSGPPALAKNWTSNSRMLRVNMVGSTEERLVCHAEVLYSQLAGSMRITVCWDVMFCNLVKMY